MSYANYFELTKCIDDCLEYCGRYPEREHSEFHAQLLKEAKRRLVATTEKSNEEFSGWRMESREDQLAWKHLARELANVQKELRRVNAIGFIDQRVMYWNRDALIAAVEAMVEYLREHDNDLDFAADRADKLERQTASALSEGDESDRALDEYLRFSKMRADALTTTKDTIANFRKALRRDLGKRDEEYQAIHWPQQVAADNTVF